MTGRLGEPADDAPAGIGAAHEMGTGFWSLAVARELDDLILDLRTYEPEPGTWVLRTARAESFTQAGARGAEHGCAMREHGGREPWCLSATGHNP